MNQNAIQAIMPYRKYGTWIFDDPDVGLVREPFVLGIPEMIDVMVKNIPNADKGFRMCFSAIRPAKIEGVHHVKLMALEEGGGWYRDVETRMGGWLCPATINYFPFFPKNLFIWAEEMLESAQVATHNMNQKLIEERGLKPKYLLIIDDYEIDHNHEEWQKYLDTHGIPKYV